MAPTSTSKRSKSRPWPSLSDAELLDVRLCDLGLTIEGTWLEAPIARVRAELAARDLRVRPHFWLSVEWFSPAGVPGVALPFYLAHPRLMRLERRQMLEVEGGTREACAALLRHEVGHAVQHAFELHRRKRWQQVFGKSSAPYPEHYRPNPGSRRYVQHLDAWYAQSHPDEDFAETFAVWLKPRSGWRRRYAGWPALRKLEYVDELMAELAGQAPRIRTRATPDALPSLRTTLRQHYSDKRSRYSVSYPDSFDRDLLRLFSAFPEDRRHRTAASFLRRNRRQIRELVSRWTGEYQFTLDQVLKQMTGRAKELKLRAVGPESRLKLDFSILLTAHTLHTVHRGRHWRPL